MRTVSLSLELIGLGLVVWGLWLWQPVAAYIIGGALMALLAQGINWKGRNP